MIIIIIILYNVLLLVVWAHQKKKLEKLQELNKFCYIIQTTFSVFQPINLPKVGAIESPLLLFFIIMWFD